MATPPSRALGGAGPSAGIPPSGDADKHLGGEEGRPVGLSSMDPSRRRISGEMAHAESFSKKKIPITNDGALSKEAVMSNSAFLGRSSGSARCAAAVSSGRDVFTGIEPDSHHAQMESSVTSHKLSSGSRPKELPVGSSDPRHASSGRSASHLKHYHSSLKGMERLHFDSDERVHF